MHKLQNDHMSMPLKIERNHIHEHNLKDTSHQDDPQQPTQKVESIKRFDNEIPVKPMHNKNRYLALDCEMVGVGPNGMNSALARVSVVSWDGEVVLDTFVKVPEPVTDFRTFVSGVRAEDIESDDAMHLDDCRALVQKTLRGKILIGHALENDLKVLKISHPWCDVRDTATYPPYMREMADSKGKRSFRPRKLRDLAWEELGKTIQILGKAHSSIEDAVAALELYKLSMEKWDTLIMLKIQMNWAKQMEINRVRMESTALASNFSNSTHHAKNVHKVNHPRPVLNPGYENQRIHAKQPSTNTKQSPTNAKHFQTHHGVRYFQNSHGVIRSSSPQKNSVPQAPVKNPHAAIIHRIPIEASLSQ